jgi:hypothetical protein
VEDRRISFWWSRIEKQLISESTPNAGQKVEEHSWARLAKDHSLKAHALLGLRKCLRDFRPTFGNLEARTEIEDSSVECQPSAQTIDSISKTTGLSLASYIFETGL